MVVFRKTTDISEQFVLRWTQRKWRWVKISPVEVNELQKRCWTEARARLNHQYVH